MKNLFHEILRCLQAGEHVALCGILASSGSTPRGAGARMAVFPDGSTLGTIGGGSVELQVIAAAGEALRDGRGFVRSYLLHPNEADDIGMICGGEVTVSVQLLTAEDIPVADDLQRLTGTNTDAWLCTVLEHGAAARMDVWEAERGLLHTLTPFEDAFRPLLCPHPVFQPGEPALYAEPIAQRGRVYIFGGGHVAQALVPVLATVGFSVTVYDERPSLADAAHFPTAEQVLIGPYGEVSRRLTLTAHDYAVIMTPGHQGDYLVLAQVLRTPARYIGCIGSSRKVAATKERLRGDGFSEADIARPYSPIGLPIGGETPEEIAISIAAQLIACRSGRL